MGIPEEAAGAKRSRDLTGSLKDEGSDQIALPAFLDAVETFYPFALSRQEPVDADPAGFGYLDEQIWSRNSPPLISADVVLFLHPNCFRKLGLGSLSPHRPDPLAYRLWRTWSHWLPSLLKNRL